MRVHYNTAGKEVKPLDKRKAIVQAAAKLIAEHGFHDATMAMIDSNLGINCSLSKSSPYPCIFPWLLAR
jgi:AcrR family transcriptional regulator